VSRGLLKIELLAMTVGLSEYKPFSTIGNRFACGGQADWNADERGKTSFLGRAVDFWGDESYN